MVERNALGKRVNAPGYPASTPQIPHVLDISGAVGLAGGGGGGGAMTGGTGGFSKGAEQSWHK
jgi:hypothetical protein